MTPNFCLTCGSAFDESLPHCPYCTGLWHMWEMRLPSIPVERIRTQIADWLGHLTLPVIFELSADAVYGFRLRFYAPPGQGEAATGTWASLVHQQARWEALGTHSPLQSGGFALIPSDLFPAIGTGEGDVMLALAGYLLDIARRTNQPAALQIWLLDRLHHLQSELRALAAYSYGSSGGVDDDHPNLWNFRLRLNQLMAITGTLTAGTLAGGALAGWWPYPAAILGTMAGGILTVIAGVNASQWMRYRSIPRELLLQRAREPLFATAIILYAASHNFNPLSGNATWKPFSGSIWPQVRRYQFPLPASDLAALISPPESSEGTALWAPDARQDVPFPPASPALLNAPFKVGYSAHDQAPIGIDPDGHGLIIGGSRTGKSSLVYQMLRNLVTRGENAPGIFLVDPHLGLADAFLQALDELPEPQRAHAVQRLRIITPDEPELIPLNLLAVPDYAWAGNAIIQIGRRIWEDYWGPRMQATLLGLFRLAHAWNLHNPSARMGLLHTVFLAFNPRWRHETAMQYLPPAERLGTMALDALLGQTTGENMNAAQQSWVTEVVSPVISKVMALELSPWLFASMHQDAFAPIEQWIRERAWIVLRLPTGTMGRESARLVASVVYNVFEAAYRQQTLTQPIPFWFIIDEAQEIGVGMRLESMLSEGAKFGARTFVLAQSLSMMRSIETMLPVVQSLLANTSTQVFFSPDPEDANLIRQTLSSEMRYGDVTPDLPSLHAWLRARIGGRWQPPTVIRVDPLVPVNHQRVRQLIRDVIAAHPGDYYPPDNWQERVTASLTQVVPPNMRSLLGQAFAAIQQSASSITTPIDTSELYLWE